MLARPKEDWGLQGPGIALQRDEGDRDGWLRRYLWQAAQGGDESMAEQRSDSLEVPVTVRLQVPLGQLAARVLSRLWKMLERAFGRMFQMHFGGRSVDDRGDRSLAP